MSNIDQVITEVRKEASEICGLDPNSSDCAVAMDNLEEVLAEASHQKQNQPQKNSLEKFCDDNPDAAECRLYED